METLTREELIEAYTRRGVDSEDLFKAIHEGEPIKNFMTTLSTGTEVLIVDNFTDMWDKANEMYNKSMKGAV